MFAHINESKLPIIFLPGLNGDARVFAPQLERFPSLIVARWEPPLQSDSLATYAARLARALDPDGPCLVGGVSFGGIVALEVARNLEARACLLIASSRDVRGLPVAIRLLRPVAAVASPATLNCAIRHGGTVAASSSRRLRRRIARLSPEELRFRRWALKVLLTWQPPSLSCPVLQIHGECDSTLALRSGRHHCPTRDDDRSIRRRSIGRERLHVRKTMLQPSKDAESLRRRRQTFVFRLVVAVLFAAGINVLAVHGIVSALSAASLSHRGLIVTLTATNICLLLLFTLLGETVIEDAVKAVVTLLLSFALARDFRHTGLAIPVSVFAGLVLAMITNGYVRHIHRKLW